MVHILFVVMLVSIVVGFGRNGMVSMLALPLALVVVVGVTVVMVILVVIDWGSGNSGRGDGMSGYENIHHKCDVDS